MFVTSFWFHNALYAVNSQTVSWIMLCNHPIIGLKRDLNLLQEIGQLINGLESEGASCKMVVS